MLERRIAPPPRWNAVQPRTVLAALCTLVLLVLPLVAVAGAQSAPARLPAVAFVASAADFPDALAAAAAAGTLGGPVLLTAPTRLDAAAADVLRRLRPELVVIAGGTAAISDAVAADITALDLPVRRVAGPTRVDTAAAIAALLEELGAGRPVVTGAPVTDQVVPGLNADLLRGQTPEQLRAAGDDAGPTRITPSWHGWTAIGDGTRLTVARYRGVVIVRRGAAGPDEVVLASSVPTTLDGRALQLVGAEVCTDATAAGVVLDFVALDVDRAIGGEHESAPVAPLEDHAVHGDAACRSYLYPTPVVLTDQDTVGLTVGGTWTTSGAALRITRASFVVEPAPVDAPNSGFAPSGIPGSGSGSGSGTGSGRGRP
jgi:hypothetical protein